MSRAACYENGVDPDIWFPETMKLRSEVNKRIIVDQTETKKALLAMQICETCPIKKKCVEVAMQDMSSIDYGIYGGTLPFERRKAIGATGRGSEGDIWQHNLRALATAKGLTLIDIPRSERPTSFIQMYLEQRPRRAEQPSDSSPS